MNGTEFLHAPLNDFHPFMDCEDASLPDNEFGQDEPGGIIVFSVNVSTTVGLEDGILVGKIKSIYATLKGRFQNSAKLSKTLFSHREVFGAAIGKFFKGKYRANDEATFDESSTSVEIIGISFELLCAIASEMAKEFPQETVLVKNNISRRIVLIKAGK